MPICPPRLLVVILIVLAFIPDAVHVRALAAAAAAARRRPFCKPVFGTTDVQCRARISACNKNGVNSPPAMKWNRFGCRNGTRTAGDGGCQCAQYCGYSCQQACRADSLCMWDRGMCKQKSTGLPTGPITDCNSCVLRPCGANAPQSPCKSACDSNTQCRNGVCMYKDERRCDSSFQCSSGSCVNSKCTPSETMSPTSQPTSEPTFMPSAAPTNEPSLLPTNQPSLQPTLAPTLQPTLHPTNQPSLLPTNQPSMQPTTSVPSNSPTRCVYPQLGSKLVGAGNIGAAYQGWSVSLSGDGNTAIIGGPEDNVNQGAAWIFIRSGPAWSQQGSKLIGTGSVVPTEQGISVSLSGDGNTAIVGGHRDNSNQGAAWIFVRNASNIWSQQGSKLIGTGNVGAAYQGYSVSLSGDGNTAILGGYGDANFVGASWIFVRNASNAWSQQGPKLAGTGSAGAPRQGYSVSISSDGNTAIVGGDQDNSGQGAAWIFVRNASNLWEQQGSKLVGAGNVGAARQGFFVSISADGNTAIVSGYRDNSNQGAAWIFVRSGITWSQQGSKLVGSGNTGPSEQGVSVSISSDGNTAIIGGSRDGSFQGAAWIFVRSGNTWSQQGSKLVGTGTVGSASQGSSVSLSSNGSIAFVGGYGDNDAAGAVWVFDVSAC